MKDESQRSKQAKMRDELEKAKQAAEECRKALNEKRKQVNNTFILSYSEYLIINFFLVLVGSLEVQSGPHLHRANSSFSKYARVDRPNHGHDHGSRWQKENVDRHDFGNRNANVKYSYGTSVVVKRQFQERVGSKSSLRRIDQQRGEAKFGQYEIKSIEAKQTK